VGENRINIQTHQELMDRQIPGLRRGVCRSLSSGRNI
jgi:hypothetical protein